jgi:hypothetical protein
MSPPTLSVNALDTTKFSQLQSSLRNALATFGANSTQYRTIKLIVDEYEAKLAMEGLSISSSEPQENGEKMQTG